MHIKPSACSLFMTPKQKFIAQIEELILSGLLLPGEKLPSERELAEQAGVSRPVIHEGLLDLCAKGLVQIQPRHGCVVSNFYRKGSLELLQTLYHFNEGMFAKKIDGELEELRRLILCCTVKKCAQTIHAALCEKNSKKNVKQFLKTLTEIALAEKSKTARELAQSDFEFYEYILEWSDNVVYALLFNSARELYIHQLSSFFSQSVNVLMKVTEIKMQLIEAFSQGDDVKAENCVFQLTSYNTYEKAEVV